MPSNKKIPTKKTVTESNDRTEIYIIFILWMVIASVFMVLGYMSNSLGFDAKASSIRWERKYQNTKIPTPITTPYIRPTPIEPGIWPTPSVMIPESRMEPNPSIGEDL